MPHIGIGAATLIGSLVGGGGAVAGGLLASRKSKEEKAALNAQTLLAQRQAGLQERLVNQASPYLGKLGGYYETLLSGDRGAISSLLGPTFSQIGQGYGNAARNIESQVPRGAEMNLALAGLETEKAGELARLVSSAPQIGAGGLADLSAVLLGQGNMAGGQASNIFDSLLAYSQKDRQTSANMGMGLGQFLGMLLANGGKNQAGNVWDDIQV